MGKVTSRLEVARKVYRDALEGARARPTPETWAKLLAAGKELLVGAGAEGRAVAAAGGAARTPRRRSRSSRRSRARSPSWR